MDLQDSSVKGGVLVVHQVSEGKHQYVVNDVVNYTTRSIDKTFVRGDELLQINDLDVQDLKPEAVAEMLAEGNPKLIVHKAQRVDMNHDQPSSTEEILHPVSKEQTMLAFSMAMMREDDEAEDGLIEENGCQAENVEDSEERDLLIVTMSRTSISVVMGRGCEDGESCNSCHGKGCSINDVVMVSESSTVTLVQKGSYRQDRPLTASIEHLASHQYLRGMCSSNMIYASPNPERITIYHYKSNFVDPKFRGLPVVLNFTDSDCFIRCCKEGGKAFLQVETVEKEKLRQITKTDERALSFVFYMRSDRSRHMKFESALYDGWFIQIINKNADFTVRMETMDGKMDDPSFLFVIQK